MLIAGNGLVQVLRFNTVEAGQVGVLASPSGPGSDRFGWLTTAAEGRRADIAKPLKGFGSGVFEVALKYRTYAFRTVYALQLGDAIWVLHAFQKKAKQGIKTPKKDIDLIRERLKRLKKELQL